MNAPEQGRPGDAGTRRAYTVLGAGVLLTIVSVVLPACTPHRDVQLQVTNMQIIDCPPSTQCLAVTVRNVGGDAGSGHCTVTWRSGIDAALGRTADPPSVLGVEVHGLGAGGSVRKLYHGYPSDFAAVGPPTCEPGIAHATP